MYCFAGNGTGFVYALNGVDGTVKWSYNANAGTSVLTPVQSPALSGDESVLYVGYTGGSRSMTALLTSTGSVKWTRSNSGDILFSPVIGGDGTVYYA